LAYLGLQILWNPPVPEVGRQQAGTWFTWLACGFAISGMNPKALLLFLTILPQFINGLSEWPISGQIAVLGLVHIANCAVIYTAVSVSSRAVLRSRPRVARLVAQASGVSMIIIAFLLIVEQT
jgi:threonine/homoserine/homoserine lactone efflux protein